MTKYKDSKLTLLNFRDLGGLETQDGKKIKSGRIYRTAIFEPRTQADRDLIFSMNIDTIIDLRSIYEVEEVKDVVPANVEYILAPPFSDGEFGDLVPTKKRQNALFFMSTKEVEGLIPLMHRMYAFLPYATDAYSNIFKCMNENKNFAFHCTAGKDRTGVGAMLVELALGRDHDQIVEQYLLSNETRKDWIKFTRFKVSLLPVSKGKKEFAYFAMGVAQSLIDSAYNAIFDKYQTIEDSLLDVYGITKEQIDLWKTNYLE